MKNVSKNLIVFEGIDGSGKTTQAKRLAEKFGSKAILTKEPTDLITGDLIREVLKKNAQVDGTTLQYLFAADRAEHLYGENGIQTLTKKKIVICDRYMFSGFAYNENKKLQKRLNEDFPLPGLTIYLKVKEEDVDKVIKRVKQRDGGNELFDEREKQIKAIKKYDKMFLKKDHCIIIDATNDEELVAEIVWGYVKLYIKKNKKERWFLE